MNMMNMHLRGIPVVGIGAGSQPEEEDALNYLPMPKDMATYRPAVLPEQDDLADYPQVLTYLQQLQILLERGAGVFDLSGAQVAEKRLLSQILAEGEVSILFDTGNGGHIEIQETSLPGLWWQRTLDAAGQCCDEQLEAGLIPVLVLEQTFSGANRSACVPDNSTLPAGVVNAPWLLAELQEQLQQGAQGHVSNLTLLPLSEEDLQFINQQLGVGKTAILSRGYGNCRITATAVDGVWWVQYYNSTDTLILNTLEVVDVPLVASASIEDLEDSAVRLAEIQEALQ